MKKLVLILLVCLMGVGAYAQNVQTHYDLGKGREYLTTTVEMFRPDKYGSTFFFIDMNYGEAGAQGVSLAYWEIARAVTLFKSPLALHVEYNGGFGQYRPTPYLAYNGAYQINDAYLGGLEYSINAKDFSRGFTFQTLFKSIRGKNDASFQLTGVWYMNLLKNKVTFSGFADFWKEDNHFFDGKEDTKFVFLSEPQLWYNFCKNFSAGSEVELSSNFGGNRGFMVNPTVAMKYTF